MGLTFSSDSGAERYFLQQRARKQFARRLPIKSVSASFGPTLHDPLGEHFVNHGLYFGCRHEGDLGVNEIRFPLKLHADVTFSE